MVLGAVSSDVSLFLDHNSQMKRTLPLTGGGVTWPSLNKSLQRMDSLETIRALQPQAGSGLLSERGMEPIRKDVRSVHL